MSTPLSNAEHREIQKLLGAYALDAVDKETARRIETHLEECVRCSIEVAEHHEVAGLMANSGGPSPAGLWDGIAAQLDGATPPSWERLASRLGTGDEEVEAGAGPIDEPAPPPEKGTEPEATPPAVVVPIGSGGTSRSRVLIRVATVVAAVAAAVAIVLGVQVDHLHRQVDALRSHPRLSAVEQSALQNPSTKKVTLAATDAADTPTPVGEVLVVLTKSGTGFVEAQGLRSLPADETYQLWGVIGNQTISLGLLGSQPRVVAFSVAGGADVTEFAITAEHAGGVVHSTHQPVVAGRVTV